MIAAFVTFLTAILFARLLIGRANGVPQTLAALVALVAANAALGFGLGAGLAIRGGLDWLPAAKDGALHGGLLGLAVGGLAFMRRVTGEGEEGGAHDPVRALLPQRPRRVNGRMVVEVEPDHTAAPINPLPWAVWVLAVPMIVLELLFSAGESGLIGGNSGLAWRVDAVQHYAFSPDMMRAMLEAGQYPVDGMWRLVTYPFVHIQITHTVFVVAILLALGKFVGESFRGWALLAVFAVSSVVGALALTAVSSVHQTLLGGYPPVYGLIGAFSYLLWTRLEGTGARRYRAFTMIGFLLLAQLLFGVLFGTGSEWVADMAGFAAGFLLSFFVAPGGFEKVQAWVRQR